MELYNKIKFLREYNGLTQEAFGELFNVSDKTVSKWEKDNGTPTFQAAKEIADYFGITLDYLLSDKVITETDEIINRDLKDREDKLNINNGYLTYIDACRRFLERNDIEDDGRLLPTIDEEGNLVENGFDSSLNDIYLNFDFLVNNGYLDLVKRFFKDRISLPEAIKLGDIELIKKLIKTYEPEVKHGSYIVDLPSFEDGTIDSMLTCLPINTPNYNKVVLILIENGAYYISNYTTGGDLGSFCSYKDEGKTALVYNILKAMEK